MIAPDDVIKSLGRSVAEEQARLRWLLMSVVSGAIKLSETELMEASRELSGLQLDARQGADAMRDIGHMVGREAEVVGQVFGYPGRFVEDASSRLRLQVDASERALHLTGQIGAFVGEIGKISNAVRVLTINGYIESTRLGGEGRAFAVIAEQLQELGEKVRSANEGIRDLAANLGKLIPQIGDNARALMRAIEHLESEHNDAMFMFQGATSAAQRDMSSALSDAQERALRVSARSNQVLGHLQFQDRMAQELRKIEQMAAHTEQVVAALFEQADPGEALPERGGGRRSFPAGGARGGAGGEGGRLAGGDVMLFD